MKKQTWCAALVLVSILVTMLPMAGMAVDVLDTDNLKPLGGTQLTVNKTWEHGENIEENRPKSYTVALLENGVETGQVAQLNAQNNWNHTFTHLNSDRIYNLRMEQVAGYATKAGMFEEILLQVESGERITHNSQLTFDISDSSYVVAKLTGKSEEDFLVWTTLPLSVQEQREFTESFTTNHGQGGFGKLSADNTRFADGNGAIYPGVTVEDGTIYFDDPSVWAQFVHGVYTTGGKQVTLYSTATGKPEQPEQPEQPEKPEQPEGGYDITVKKTVVGDGITLQSLPKDFQIKLEAAGHLITLTLGKNADNIGMIARDEKTVIWQIRNVPAGEYLVSEAQFVVAEYTCAQEMPQQPVLIDNSNIMISITNTYTPIETEGGQPDDGDQPDDEGQPDGGGEDTDIPEQLPPTGGMPDDGTDGDNSDSDTDIPEVEVPTAPAPDFGEEEEDLGILFPDPDVPLGNLPMTGTMPAGANLWLYGAVGLTGLGLALATKRNRNK